MPDGPVVALIVLIVGVLLAAGYGVLEYRKHGRSEARHRGRGAPAPLPLFGTDMLSGGRAVLVPRAGAEYPGDDAAPDTAARAERRGRDRDQSTPFAPVGAAPAAAPTPLAERANGRRNGASHDADGASSAPALPRRPASAPPPQPAAATPTFAPAAAGRGGAAAVEALDSKPLEGETLRFAIPDEGTLQFLPGRLEVVAGPDAGREVRFVRPGGDQPAEVTFGRSEGPAYRHVQLLARTVSRQHAVMTLLDDHWSLRNLSATNPVVLNGRPLAADELAPLVIEGDRIEMGEVVFVFRDR